MRHLSQGASLWDHGNFSYLLNLRHLFHSITLDVWLASQLKRCSYALFRKLILWSLRWSIIVELSLSSCLMKVLQAKMSRSIGEMNRHLREGQLDHEDRVSFVSPLSTYLTSWISGRDSCLVGVSCHIPSFRYCLVLHLVASCLNFI